MRTPTSYKPPVRVAQPEAMPLLVPTPGGESEHAFGDWVFALAGALGIELDPHRAYLRRDLNGEAAVYSLEAPHVYFRMLQEGRGAPEGGGKRPRCVGSGSSG